MADQVVLITMSAPFGDGGQDNKIVISWTSATAQTVSAAIASTFAAAEPAYQHGVKPKKLKGFIVRVVTNPGSTTPTDNYDLTLLDEDGVDVAGGNLVDRDQTNTEQWIPSDPPFIDGELTFTIANAGAVKTGSCTIYMAR